jgi:predicted CXXCH cytochrome family protein
VNKALLDYTLKIRLPVTIFVIIISFALTYYIARPARDGIGYAPQQPIKFLHKLHAGTMNIDCKYCHSIVEKERHAGIPPVSTCINCHSIARKNKPEIIKLTQYFNDNKALEWKRVHKVPEFVYFNHSVHVNKGIDCKHCHGDVARMDVLTQVESFTMGACLSCHRNAKERLPELADKIQPGPTYCYACHR